MRSLHRICGRQGLLPRRLEITLCHDPTSIPLCHGGFADVWKGQYDGREVISKVLRVYQTSNFEWIKKVGRPRVFAYTNELTVSHPEVLQRGCDVEGTSSSKRATAVRRDHDRHQVRDGIGVDDEG